VKKQKTFNFESDQAPPSKIEVVVCTIFGKKYSFGANIEFSKRHQAAQQEILLTLRDRNPRILFGYNGDNASAYAQAASNIRIGWTELLRRL
jgi:DNA polymerase elongation subunit (family B)